MNLVSTCNLNITEKPKNTDYFIYITKLDSVSMGSQGHGTNLKASYYLE